MTHIWLFLALVLTLNFSFAQAEEVFIYQDKGRRDPFRPLVDENGQYVLGAERPYSSGVLNLSGILWDSQGKSSALINNQVVKIGESISGFTIENITKDSVTLSKDGKEYTIELSIEKEE
ncbi:MAG: DUF2531 family protein [Omnitrophica bacterium]|nr:DUF2531 family protein [Candidatus Omnitrophota bacterium]